MKIFQKIKLYLRECGSKVWLIITACAVVFAAALSVRLVVNKRK